MRQNLSTLLLLSLILFVSGLIFILAFGYDQEKPAIMSKGKNSQKPLSIIDMAYNTYRDEELVSKIQVQEFQVRPRKFGIFRIRNINEVALRKARFDLFHGTSAKAGQDAREEVSLSAGLSESINGLAGLRGMGQITRATMDPMVLNIYRDGQPSLHLQAGRAIFDLKKQLFDFKKTRLLGPRKNFQLVTPLLRWDEQHKVFLVPGEYRLITGEGIRKGSGAVVDGEFNLRPVAGQNSDFVPSR